MLGYFLAFLYLTLRGWQRLTQVELWAEDGATMLRDALTHGWPSVFYPTDATPQVFQRGVGLIGFHLFPIQYFPHVMAYTSLLVSAFVLGHFARKEYRWLVANDRIRLLIVLSLCSIPGLTEMLGNMANTNWLLFFGCCLLLLKVPNENLKVPNLLYISLSMISMGTGLLLLPLWGWRAWARRAENCKIEWSVLFLLLGHVVLLRALKSSTFFQIPSEHLFVWFKTYWRVVLESTFLQPWLGDAATIYLFSPGHSLLNSCISTVLLIAFCYTVWRQRTEKSCQGALTLLFLVSLWPILCWIGRPGSIVTFKEDTPSSWFFAHRYSFPTAFAAVLAWSILLRKKLPLHIVFCVLVLLHAHGRWKIPAYGSNNRWAIAGPQLSEALHHKCTEKVRIPVYPERLDFDFECR